MSSCFAVLSSDLLVGGGECALLFPSLTPGEGWVLVWLTHWLYAVSQNRRGMLVNLEWESSRGWHFRFPWKEGRTEKFKA